MLHPQGLVLFPNEEVTSLGLKIDRKNTNQCLSALGMEY